MYSSPVYGQNHSPVPALYDWFPSKNGLCKELVELGLTVSLECSFIRTLKQQVSITVSHLGFMSTFPDTLILKQWLAVKRIYHSWVKGQGALSDLHPEGRLLGPPWPWGHWAPGEDGWQLWPSRDSRKHVLMRMGRSRPGGIADPWPLPGGLVWSRIGYVNSWVSRKPLLGFKMSYDVKHFSGSQLQELKMFLK